MRNSKCSRVFCQGPPAVECLHLKTGTWDKTLQYCLYYEIMKQPPANLSHVLFYCLYLILPVHLSFIISKMRTERLRPCYTHQVHQSFIFSYVLI